jgi:hypothetical protein
VTRATAAETGVANSSSVLVPLILTAWLAGVAAFAWWRIPFHDEWFSITLARDTPRDRFFASLNADVHPPWIAMLDRGLESLVPDRRVLPIPRIVASFTAIVLLRDVARRRWTASPPVWTALAAFHPVVFMFVGAVRWYPFALLADGLRAWALWAAPRSRGCAAGAFVGGAILGLAVGYGEAVLLAVDCAWLVAAKRIGSRASSVGIAAVAIAGATMTVITSPLSGHLGALLRGGATRGPGLAAFATWAALGPLGEALPPSPWFVLYAFAIPGIAWALVRGAMQPGTRAFTTWVLTVALGWALLTRSGVVHPRYSLALWYLTTCALGTLFAEPGALRAAAFVTAAYLGLDLALTIRQRSFPMADENAMSRDDCPQLVPPGAELIVSAYERTTLELQRTCEPAAPLVTAGFIRHYDGQPMGEVAVIRDAIRPGEVVDFVRVNVRGVSLEQTNNDVHAVLSERCELSETRTAGTVPQAWLRARLKPDLSKWHYTAERWRCFR